MLDNVLEPPLQSGITWSGVSFLCLWQHRQTLPYFLHSARNCLPVHEPLAPKSLPLRLAADAACVAFHFGSLLRFLCCFLYSADCWYLTSHILRFAVALNFPSIALYFSGCFFLSCFCHWLLYCLRRSRSLYGIALSFLNEVRTEV